MKLDMNKKLIVLFLIDLINTLLLSISVLFYPAESGKGVILLFIISSIVILSAFFLKFIMNVLLFIFKKKTYSSITSYFIILFYNIIFLPIDNNDLNPFNNISFSICVFCFSIVILFTYNKILKHYKIL